MNEQNKNNIKAGALVFVLLLWAVAAIACSAYFLNLGGAASWYALPNIAFHALGWETFRRKIANPVINPGD